MKLNRITGILSTILTGLTIHACAGGNAVQNPAGGTTTNGASGNGIVKIESECASVTDTTENLKCIAKLPRVTKIVTNASKMYLMTQLGIFVSSDGGKVFSKCGAINKEPQDIVVAGSNILVSSVDGIFLSNNDCVTFAKTTQTIDSKGYSSLVNKTMNYDNGALVVRSEKGILSSTGSSTNFKKATFKDTTIMNIDSMNYYNGVLFFTSETKAYYSLSPIGKDMVVGAPTGIGAQAYMRHVSLDKKVLTATNKGLFISDDSGKTFSEAESEIKGTFIADVFYKNGTIYAITGNGLGGYSGDGALAMSTDGGKSYEVILFMKDSKTASSSKFMGHPWPTSVYADGANIFVGTINGVYKSTDGGKSFAKSTINRE